ncbi:MipA/OmpV family protein [Vibrio thalassae]|nr:MipA/OmpV family protein [Vibrio thalassae]
MIYIRSGNIYTKTDGWFTTVGGKGTSDLFKSQNKNSFMIFDFGYQSEKLNIDPEMANYRFYENSTENINLSSYIKTSGIEYDLGDADSLIGMASRVTSRDLGLSADFSFEKGTLSTYVQHDISGVYNSFVGGATYFLPLEIGTMDFVPFAGLSYQSAEYVDYYFGVHDNEVTEQRSSYKGQSDVSYQLGYELIIPVSKNWNITQTASYTRLGDNISDSPIVDNANQWIVGATASYYF